MKRNLFILLIIGCFIILITGCGNKQKDNRDEMERQKEEKILSCLVNKLGGYITTEKSIQTDIPQNTFTNKDDKISYYNSASTDENNLYVIVKSNEAEVIRDFDLYFSSKYETYQTYFTTDNIHIYIHNNLNDVDLNDLKKCSNITDDSIEVKEKEMDSKVIEKLNKTKKIVIKTGDEEIGIIKDKEVVKEILDIVSSSRKYGDTFFCDGYIFDFEMYNDNGKLIDTIYVWGDGNRLIPESIHGGCSYYSASNDTDIREIIERETDYIFYNLFSLSDSCEDLELIYEDEKYNYYFDCKKYGKMLIRFNLTGLKMNIKYAIDNNYISMEQLSAYEEMILKVEK